MLDRRINWRRALAWEWLWALGSFAVIVAAAFLLPTETVSAFSLGGIAGTQYGDFWYWVLGVYAAVVGIRVTIWAARTVIQR